MITGKIQGFSLIELLVAVILLSIGVLGAAAMQISGLRNVHNAYLLSQSNFLAQDIGERLRGNPVGVENKAYHLAHLAPGFNQSDATADCYSQSGCSPVQLAQEDTRAWRLAVADLLGTGEGLVCIDSTPFDGNSSTSEEHQCDGTGTDHAVKIWWQEHGNTDNSRRRHVLRLQL